MSWRRVHKGNQDARRIADRHYNRQKIGSSQFTQPGRNLVLLREDALWVTAFPYAEYVNHQWAGAWCNSLFRNEGRELSSELILAAVAITRTEWPVPPLGMITFVDPRKVPPTKVRGEDIYGYCYKKAGFHLVGFSKRDRLWCWQMFPEDMPPALQPWEFDL